MGSGKKICILRNTWTAPYSKIWLWPKLRLLSPPGQRCRDWWDVWRRGRWQRRLHRLPRIYGDWSPIILHIIAFLVDAQTPKNRQVGADGSEENDSNDDRLLLWLPSIPGVPRGRLSHHRDGAREKPGEKCPDGPKNKPNKNCSNGGKEEPNQNKLIAIDRKGSSFFQKFSSKFSPPLSPWLSPSCSPQTLHLRWPHLSNILITRTISTTLK